MPSIPGSMTSSTISSNSSGPLRRSRASFPSPIVVTSMPSRARACSTTSRTAASSSTTRILLILCLQKLYFNDRTYPFFGPEGDLTPYPLDQVFAYRKPEPEPSGLAPSAVEAVEDMGKILLCYAFSLVLHSDAVSVETQPHPPAAVGVLDRVAHKREQNLL